VKVQNLTPEQNLQALHSAVTESPHHNMYVYIYPSPSTSWNAGGLEIPGAYREPSNLSRARLLSMGRAVAPGLY
jgi:hypothetical protein